MCKHDNIDADRTGKNLKLSGYLATSLTYSTQCEERAICYIRTVMFRISLRIHRLTATPLIFPYYLRCPPKYSLILQQSIPKHL